MTTLNPNIGDRVRVHHGGNRGDWKLRTPTSKFPEGRSEYVAVSDCEFVVDEKLRQERLQRKKNNLHAWILGTFEGYKVDWDTDGWEEVEYYPSTFTQFRTLDGRDVYAAEKVYFVPGKVLTCNPRFSP